VSVHTCLPGHVGILADGCDRCTQQSRSLLELDVEKIGRLWDKMIEVERDYGGYATENERRACRALYHVALGIERLTPRNPWRPWIEVRDG